MVRCSIREWEHLGGFGMCAGLGKERRGEQQQRLADCTVSAGAYYQDMGDTFPGGNYDGSSGGHDIDFGRMTSSSKGRRM